jgi:hypothetical protein
LAKTNRLHPAFFSSYKHEIILACAWIIVQSLLLFHYGIVTEFEASKYIAEADNLVNHGTVSSSNFWLYSTQIFLIATAQKLHAGFMAVAIVQFFFNALATWALFRFAASVSNKNTALVTSLLFVFTIPLQTVNCSLQTESLFFSFTILFSCYLLRLQQLSWKRFVLIFLFLVVICFTRPTGLLWVPCTFLYLFFRFFKALPVLIKIGITAVASIGFLFFLNMALGSGGELDFMLPFRDESIICGVPTRSYPADINTSSDPNSIFGLIYYVTHNFDQFIRLAWLRSKAFLGLTRTYYSSGHNIYLILYFYPLYFLAVFSIRRWFKTNTHLLLYCFSLIFLTWSTVILTCDDWHNRFFLTIVPYIYILAIPAIKNIIGKANKTLGRNYSPARDMDTI